MFDEFDWSGAGRKAKVKTPRGFDRARAEELAARLAALSAVDTDLDQYTAKDGWMIKRTGQEQDTPIYELLQAAQGSGRRPEYDDVDTLLEKISQWSGRRPVSDVQPPAVFTPSVSIREKALSVLGARPELNREGLGRRGLESAAAAAALSLLAGGSGRSALRAGLGGGRGASRAALSMFGDDLKAWEGDTRAAAEAVKLDDSRVRSLNAGEVGRVRADQGNVRLGLDAWKAEGVPLTRELSGALGKLRAAQADEREANNVAEDGLRRQDRQARDKQKSLEDANDATIKLFGELTKSKRLSEKGNSELVERMGLIREYERKGGAAPDWVYQIGDIANLTPEEKRQLDQRDKVLEQAGFRLKLQERGLTNAERRTGIAERSQQDTARHRRYTETHPRAGAAVDPMTGPKATDAEKYGYLVSNHDQLIGQNKQVQGEIDGLESLARGRQAKEGGVGQLTDYLTEQEYAVWKNLTDDKVSLNRLAQSATNKLVEMETKYPQLRDNYIRAHGDGNKAGDFKSSTRKAPVVARPAAPRSAAPRSTAPKASAGRSSGAPAARLAAPKKAPAKAPAMMKVPGVRGQVRIEKL